MRLSYCGKNFLSIFVAQFFQNMPFSSNRNSREDNSKKPRSNSDSFRGDKRSSFNSSRDSKSGKPDQDRKFNKFDKSGSRDNKFEKFPREGKFDNRNRDDKFDRSNRDGNSERPARDNKFERPNRDGKFDRTSRDNKFDRSSRDNKFDRPARDNKFDRSSRDNKFDRPARDNNFDRPARDNNFDRPSRDNNFDRPSRDNKFDRPARDNKFDRSSRDNKFDRPSRDNKFGKPQGDRKFGKPRFGSNDDKGFGDKRPSRRFDEAGQDRDSRDRRDNRSDGRTRKPISEKKYNVDANDDGLIRLNRYIANSGICSRRKADELIEAGVISVNGEVVTELGSKVDPATDEIRYNDERLKREKMVYVLLNKPKDYITTTDDPQERKTVMHLVSKATKERIYPVGRLDRNTTGLLLLTNDGNLAEKLSHPRNNISKIYQVELSKNLTQGDFNKIQFGIELEDGLIKPDDLSYVVGASKREVGIQIHSGKNRIVRRIFESLGYEVVKLDRVVYANLTKKDLPRGRWRYLEEKEIVQLKHLMK